MRISPIAAVLLLAATPLVAAEPVTRQVPCPIGGPPVETVGARGCQHFGRVFLSLRPRTSCDFVTRLPTCKAKGLPLYRPFQQAELPRLNSVVTSGEYDKVRAGHTRYFLAHWVARQMGDDNPRGEFNLLMSGLWYDTARVLEDRIHLGKTREVLDRLLPETEPVERAVLTGAGAYLSMLLGDWEDGDKRLARMRYLISATPEAAWAETYANLLQACAEARDKAAEACSPFLEREGG